MKTFIDLTKKIYHKVDIEIQYLMYTLNDSWKAEQISANGTPNSAEMIHDYLIESIEKIRENGVDSVYIVHNHPNTNPKPSFMDYYNYQTIESYLRLADIKVIDYMIVSPYGYYSFKESGRLSNDTPTPSWKECKSLPLKIKSIEDVNK